MPAHPSLIQLLPLITSSATLGIALFQFPLVGAFLDAKASLAGWPLSAFWRASLHTIPPLIVAPLLTSATSGFIAMRSLSGSTAASWYMYGAISALGHLAFVPLAVPLIHSMADRASETSKTSKDADGNVLETNREAANRRDQVKWFKIHAVRSVTVDLATVFFFYKAVMEVFS